MNKDQLILLRKEVIAKLVDTRIFLENLPDSREKSLALTKIDECRHWAIELLSKQIVKAEKQ